MDKGKLTIAPLRNAHCTCAYSGHLFQYRFELIFKGFACGAQELMRKYDADMDVKAPEQLQQGLQCVAAVIGER